jgi:hypothetical protein
MTPRKGTVSRVIEGLHSSADVILVIRSALLALGKNFLIRKFNKSPNFEGSFGTLDVNLLQGALVLRGLNFAKLSEGRRVLEGSCDEVSSSIQWRELLRGTLVGCIHINRPRLEILADRESDGNGKPPAEALLDLCREMQGFLRFHLESLEVSKGRVEYISQFTSPPFKLALDGISLLATNLTNIAVPRRDAAARILMKGQTTGKGRFWMRLTMPSLSDALTFELQAGVDRVDLVDLNDLLRAYAKFDVRRGLCSINAEFKVQQGFYNGFVQPHFKNLDVFAWQKEHGKSFYQLCRQAAIALFASLFKNQPRDELSLKIPISGTFSDADVDTWAAVGSLLKNMFVRSWFTRFQSKDSQTQPHRWTRLSFFKRQRA